MIPNMPIEKDKTELNVFKAAFYFFIPVERITKKYKDEYDIHWQRMQKDSRIKNADGEIDYCNLDEFNQTFKYGHDNVYRYVDLKVFLIRHTCSLNSKGRFYLVVGTGIDMVFCDGQQCESQDLVKLKKAFYEHGRNGLFYENGDKSISLRTWLDKNLKQISGKDYHGKYGRYYIVNIQAVKISQFDDLPRQFVEKYYGSVSDRMPYYDEVVNDADRMAYSLLYGNDNINAVPEDTIKDVFKDTFFNNKAEKMFAGNKTIVFLKTHSEWPLPKTHSQMPLSIGIEGLLNILDICMVMEARYNLKRIQNTMRSNHPSDIKDALASISGYLGKNPFRLSEIDSRTEYLYQVLGVKKLFDVVMKQGELLSDSSNIRMTISLNVRMYWLTGAALGAGGLDLLVNILCCDNLINSSDMCNCFLGGAELQGGCCAVVGVLLGLVLAASIIVMAVYQVKLFYKLKDLEDKINQLQ